MEIYRVVDPLEIDFSLERVDIDYVEGTTLKEYLKEFGNIACVSEFEEVEVDYIPKETDTIFFSVEFGGKAAKIIIAIIIIIVIIIASIYTGGGAGAAAAGGGGAAGGTTGGGVVAGGAVGGAANAGAGVAGYVGEFTGVSSLGTTAAGNAAMAAGMSGSSLLGNVALMAGSMLVNALLAPKAPSSDDAPPERSSYMWGGDKTQSAQMIPVPIVLGKFALNGNLIGTATEPRNIYDLSQPIQDVGSFIYGLCANRITDLHELYLNKLKVSEFADEDISVFYTKGTENQSYVKGLDDTNSIEDETYRFGGLDTEPLAIGEPVIPGLVTEVLYNESFQEPQYATLTSIINSSYNFYTVEGQNLYTCNFLGVCDISGIPIGTELENLDNNTAIGNYIRVNCYSREYTNSAGDSSIFAYTNSLDVIGTEEYVNIFPYTSGPIYLTFNNENPTEPPYSYPNVLTVQYVGEALDPIGSANTEFVLQITNAPNIEYTYIKGSVCSLTQKTYTELVQTAQETEGLPDIFNVDETYDGGWKTHNTSLDSVDFFKIEVLAPGGLFLTIQEKEDTDDYYTWCSFEYKVSRMDGITELSSCTLDSSPLLRTITTPSAWASDSEDDLMSKMLFCKKNIPVLGIVEMYKSQLMWSISSDDILSHPLTLGTLKTEYSNNGNVLPKSSYKISIRINNRGICAKQLLDYDSRGEHYGTFLSHGSHTDIAVKLNSKFGSVRDYAYSKTLVFYRVKEYNLEETPNYSGVANLGIVANATEAFNTTLPQISAICSNYIKVIDYVSDPKILGNWTFSNSSNPSFIVLDLLWNNYYGAAIGEVDPTIESSEAIRWERFKQRVDIEKFVEFAEYCDEGVSIPGLILPTDESSDIDKLDFIKVEGVWTPKRYTCNAVVDTTSSVVDWITKILGSYDAIPIFKGSVLSLNYERAIDANDFVPVQLFTNTNIIKDSFIQSFINPDITASIIETTFIDEDNYYEKTPVLYMPQNQAYIDLKKKSTVNVFGLTKLPRVLSRLNQLVHKTNYLKQHVEFSTSMQGFTLRVGDMIGVTHEFIEWGSIITDTGVIENPDDTVFSGRVVSWSQDVLAISMVLDRPIAIDNVIVDLTGKYVYLQSSKTDANTFAQITGYTTNTVEDFVSGKTIIEFTIDPEDQQLIDDIIPGSLYLLGQPATVYKNVIISELSFNSVKQVKISGTVFEPELYDYSNVYISDISGNSFDKADVIVRDLTASYQEGYTGVEVKWKEPLVISKNSTVSLVEYIIYEKVIRNTLSVAGGSKWVEQYRTTSHSWIDTDDDWNSDSTRYYKITPVLKVQNTMVNVPLSWAIEAEVEVYLSTDFLEAPVCSWEFSKNEYSDDLVNMHVFVNNFKYYHPTLNETLLVWLRQSDSSSTDWLGPMNLVTTSSTDRFTSSITVNSTSDLPTNGAGQVFGLVIIDDKDVVFINGSFGNTLYLKYNGIDSIGRRFSAGFSHQSGVSVKNAHLGFYNVKYFATIEDNGLEYTKNSSGVMIDSLFSYDYDTKVVTKISATDSSILDDLETIANGGAEYFRLTTGASDLITTPIQIGKADNGTSTKLYIDTGLTGRNLEDLQINYVYKDASSYPYTINLVQLKESEYGDYPGTPCVKAWKSTSSYFTIPNLPTTKYVWVAITHAQIKEGEEQYGFTSFPIMVGE